jgi:hypothetical protein
MDSYETVETTKRFIAALIGVLPRDLTARQMQVLMNDQDLLQRMLRGLYLSNSSPTIWPDEVVWQSTTRTFSGSRRGSRSKAKFNVKDKFDELGIRTIHSNTGECPPRAFTQAVEAIVLDVVLKYGQIVWPKHDNQIRRDMEPFKPLKWQWVHSVLHYQSHPMGQLGPLLTQGSSNVFYLDDGMAVAFTYIPRQGVTPAHWCMDFGSKDRQPGDRIFWLEG